jgi:hypothetical protein
VTFSAWCACQSARVHVDLDGIYCEILRRRFRREWAAEKARLWAAVEARMNFSPAIRRDIAEWRVEE